MISRVRRTADPSLLVIVAVAALATAYFALQCAQYFIQPDELEYVKQARQIWSQFHPLTPSQGYFGSWSQLGPITMAPAWGLFSPATAHKVQQVVNALIMASAAIPAYLLARRVTRLRASALAVAALTVAVPWMAAATTMMTEVVAYPVFLWAVLGIQRAVVTPSWRRDAVALAGVGLAFTARPQIAVLGLVLAGAVIGQELRYATRGTGEGDALARRRTRVVASVRRHWLLLAAAVPVVLALAAGVNVFGGYSEGGVAGHALTASGIWPAAREAVAYIAVGVGLLPLALAAAWAAVTLHRPLDRERHAFALILAGATLALGFAVGSFNARYTSGVNTRYLFYLAPLLFCGMLALAEERRRATAAIVVAGLLAGWLVYDARLTQFGPSLVAPDQTFHVVLQGRVLQLGKFIGLPHATMSHGLGALTAGLALGVAALRWARRELVAGVLVTVAVLGYCVAETGYVFVKVADTQKGVSQAFLDGRSWIDDALPPGATAQVLLSTLGQPASAPGAWWDVSFWNRQAGRTLQTPSTPDLQQPFPGFFDAQDQGRLVGGVPYPGATPEPPPDPTPYFVRAESDRTLSIVGEHVIASQFGIDLLKVPTPPMAAWRLLATDDVGRLNPGYAGSLLVYPTVGAGAHVAHLSFLAPYATRSSVRIHSNDLTRVVQVPAKGSVSVDIPFRLSAAARTRITMVATGKPAADGTPGGAQVGTVTIR